MALLRPCGRLAKSFAKLAVSCQGELTRDMFRVTRTQGYVTVTQKPACSSKNTEMSHVPSINSNINEDTELSQSLVRNMQKRLISLCLSAKNGRIRDEDLVRILQSYAVSKDAIENSSGLILLSYCGNMLRSVKSADRRMLTKQVWKIISEKASTLTLDHYNTLLCIHAQNNEKIDPKNFLNSMNVTPDETTYKYLLSAAAKCGDVQSALYILSRIKSEGYSLNKDVFNLLILAHATNKDIKAALSTLETMISTGIQPSVETYANIACGYAYMRDIHNTIEILNSHSLNASQVMEVIKCLSNANFGQKIPDVLKYLPSSVTPNDSVFLETLIELIHNGKPEDAYELLNFVAPKDSNDETQSVYDDFLKNMVRAKIAHSTILKFMTTIMTVNNYPMAIMDVGEGALRSGDRDLAMAVFEAMHERKIKVRPHYYWPLLVQASRSHGETDVFRTLRHMLCLNVPLDHETIFTYVLPYVNIVDAFVTFRKFGDLGLESSVVFTPIICYLLHQGKVREAVVLCSRTRAPLDFERVLGGLTVAYKMTKNINDLVKMFKFAPPEKFYPEEFLFNTFGRAPIGEKAEIVNKFLRAFKAADIYVANFTSSENSEDDDAPSTEIMMMNPLDPTKSSSRIPHPRDMTLEELECHLIELKAKGMNVRGVLRKLLQLYCRGNNIDRVEELKKEYDEKKFLWTPGMCSNLLDAYVKHDRVNEAMNLYTQIQHNKNFKIDDFKIVHLAIALVNANRISDAFAILESTNSSGGSRISKDCWRLLDTVAHSSHHELTESMLEILVNAGFCDRTNMMLGPLVRQHLVNNDLNSAVDTFEKCAKHHRHTPLRQELVNAIIEKTYNSDEETKNEMMKLLERVQNITTSIRGVLTTKMDLVVALARFGLTDELRNFLQDNPIPEYVFNRNLTLMTEDHKLSILTTILHVSTEMPNINRSFIYEQILAVHSRFGDCEAALELWKKLSAEETPMSRNFIIAFESLLKKNNVPLPEVFLKTRLDQ